MKDSNGKSKNVLSTAEEKTTSHSSNVLHTYSGPWTSKSLDRLDPLASFTTTWMRGDYTIQQKFIINKIPIKEHHGKHLEH